MRWEYHREIMPSNPDVILACCQKAGQDGWELASVSEILVNVGPAKGGVLTADVNGQPQQAIVWVAMFKRPHKPGVMKTRREHNGQRSTAGINGDSPNAAARSVGAAVGAIADSGGPAAGQA